MNLENVVTDSSNFLKFAVSKLKVGFCIMYIFTKHCTFFYSGMQNKLTVVMFFQRWQNYKEIKI